MIYGFPSATRVPVRGGSSGNGACCGVSFASLYYGASGAVWGFGAALTYPILEQSLNAEGQPSPLAEINSKGSMG